VLESGFQDDAVQRPDHEHAHDHQVRSEAATIAR
jgi:hypothetical protein